MRAFEQRLKQHKTWQAAEQAAAIRAVSQSLIESDVGEDGNGEESSGLSTVSSSKYEGLEDGWWKENSDSEVVEGKRIQLDFIS